MSMYLAIFIYIDNIYGRRGRLDDRDLSCMPIERQRCRKKKCEVFIYSSFFFYYYVLLSVFSLFQIVLSNPLHGDRRSCCHFFSLVPELKLRTEILQRWMTLPTTTTTRTRRICVKVSKGILQSIQFSFLDLVFFRDGVSTCTSSF